MLIAGDDLMTHFEFKYSSPLRFGQCFKAFAITHFKIVFFKLGLVSLANILV